MSLLQLRQSKEYALQKPDHYFSVYDRYWSSLRYKAIKILEVGIDRGGSLELWRDYFPSGHVYGIDFRTECVKLELGERITLLPGDQKDNEGLVDIAMQHGPFDIVIDDASHIGALSQNTFLSLFPAIVSGGLYAIEDWGTGYWHHWPDGAIKDKEDFARRGGNVLPSHQHGMVGFVKQLIDVCNTSDRTHGQESSTIASMELMPGLVILRKADA